MAATIAQARVTADADTRQLASRHNMLISALGSALSGPLSVSALGVGVAAPAAGIDSNGRLNVSVASSTAVTNTFANTDTTHSAADSIVAITAGSGSGADAYLRWTNNVTPYSAGVDTSDAGAWVLSAASALGSSNILRATSTDLRTLGAVGIGMAPPAAGLYSADILKVTKTQTTQFTSIFENTNSVTATAHACLNVRSGGASAGDPLITWSISGIVDWSMGLDNSDSDALVISGSGSLGTSNYLRMGGSEVQVPAGIGLRVNGELVAKTTVRATCSSAISPLTGAMQDVPGCTLALTPGDWTVTGTFDFVANGDVGQNGVGQLASASGSPVISDSATLAIFGLVVGGRGTVSQTWRVVCAANASVKLQADKSGGAGTSLLAVNGTTITATYNGNP